MNAFHFGQRLRIKLAAGPGLPAPTSSLTGKTTLPTQPPQNITTGTMSLARSGAPKPQFSVSGSGLQFGGPQQAPAPATNSQNLPSRPSGEPTWANFGYEFAQNFNPWNGRPKSQTGFGSYGDVLSRWYNPWTKQQITEKGEHGLMRGGQAALGTAAVAGLAAGGLAAAPALGLGGTGTAAAGTTGTTAATAAAPVAAATQTPAGQQFMNRAGQFATQAQQTLGNLSANYFTRVEPTLNRIGYKPEDVAMDGAAVLTGNFDKIKGPGWGFKTPSLPQGAPSLPRPLEAWRSYYGADPGAPAGVARAGM